jgi:hypothetical protein
LPDKKQKKTGPEELYILYYFSHVSRVWLKAFNSAGSE